MDSKDLTVGHESAAAREQLRALAASAFREPPDAEALVEYGSLLFEPFHDDANARAVLMRAAELLPHDGRPLFWLAKIAIHRECDDEAARRYLEQALEREPNSRECISLLVSLLQAQPGGLDRCRELVDRLAELARDWPLAHAVRAQVFERLGDLEEAERSLGTALALSERPTDEAVPDTYFERVVTGRRPSPATIGWIRERLVAVRSAKG